MRININRLKQDIETLGKIGYKEGKGITREAFTDAYAQGEAFVSRQMQSIGLAVRKDGLGNLYGRLKGEEGNPAILVGSHIDTVPGGGKFDGAYGVLAAIECLRTIKENGIKPFYDIEVIVFNAEEGEILGGTFGSRGLVGRVNFDDPAMGKLLLKLGLDPQAAKRTKLDSENTKCYLELHIEQGGSPGRIINPHRHCHRDSAYDEI